MIHDEALMDYTRSMLSLRLDDDDPEGPTKKVEGRVIAFFKERTGA
jgi:hypothetical protein